MPNLGKYLPQTFQRLGITIATISAIANTHPAQSADLEEKNGLVSQNIPPSSDILPPVPSGFPVPQPTPVLPPPKDLLESPPSEGSPVQPIPGEIPAKIVVKKFHVVGSTVFSAGEFDRVTAKFTGYPLSLSELLQVRSAITQLYLDKGYITSAAYIPPQKLQDGSIIIQVIEGELEEIKVTGLNRLNPDYIKSRIQIATPKPLNRQQLLRALQLLQTDPLVENLAAELSNGSKIGTSILEIRVTEARSFSQQFAVDNGRSPSVGSFRRRVQLNEGNLFGGGDRLSLAYSNTNGSNVVDFSYTLPVNSRNGTIGFTYTGALSDVIEPPFNELDINSSSQYYDLTFRQPISQSPTHEFALGVTASRRESQATFLDGTIPFPALGADEEGKTKISAVRFFQEWSQRNEREVWALRSQFNIGLDVFNATNNQTSPDGQFFSWRGQGQWVRLLAPDTLLLLRTDVQLADRGLLSLEQFGLGGGESVRGYRQDRLLTDNGLLLSGEVRLPILRLPESKSVLHLVPFVDYGVGWNRSARPTPDPNSLLSVGLGLRWQSGNNFTARLDWGIPLIEDDASDRTWQENGFHFSVQFNSF
jgi:hemolysin activation/secretion protein